MAKEASAGSRERRPSKAEVVASKLDRTRAYPLTPGLVAAVLARHAPYALEHNLDEEFLQWSGPMDQWLSKLALIACMHHRYLVVRGGKPAAYDEALVEEMMGLGDYSPEREDEFIAKLAHNDGVAEMLSDRVAFWNNEVPDVRATKSISKAPDVSGEDIVSRLRKRADIRRQVSTRKSVQEGKPDRLADLLDEAASEIELLRKSAA